VQVLRDTVDIDDPQQPRPTALEDAAVAVGELRQQVVRAERNELPRAEDGPTQIL
jgi:hypothetical protein